MVIPPAKESPGSLGDRMVEDVAWRLHNPAEIVILGTDVMDGSYGPKGWWAENPDRVISASWSSKATLKAKRTVDRWARSGRTHFAIRDRYSLARIRRDVPSTTTCSILAADLAFLAGTAAKMPSELQDRLHQPTIAVIPRKELPLSVIRCLFDHGYRVLIIQHDLRRKRPNLDAFREELRSGRLLAYLPTDPSEYLPVRAILSQCQATVSGLMHGCISSLAMHTPAMMLIDYNDKAKGVFADFGLEECVTASLAEAVVKLPAFLQNSARIRLQIASNLDEVRDKARRSFSSHSHTINKSGRMLGELPK